MALPATIYRTTIQLSHIDRNLYETLQITVAQHPSETAERLLARILAYAICYEQDLSFTKGVAAGDEPDLWVKGPDGRVTAWVEVGLPDPARLIKASRHAQQVILIAFGSGLARWQEQHLAKLSTIHNLTVIGLDLVFLNYLVARLERSITWSITITEGLLYLNVGDETMETGLTLLAGTNPL